MLHFEVFYILSSIFDVQSYSLGLGTSVSIVLHYYHIMLYFCLMNNILGGYFFRVLLFGKYFLGFLLAKSIFWVIQNYPTPLIPVCRFAKFSPWAHSMLCGVRFFNFQ